MSDPTFPKINSQIRTTLRWYDSLAKKNANRPECAEEMEACPFKLLTPNDSLLPFQFARPNSLLGISSWVVYNANGEVAYDISDDVGNITVTRFTGYDYLTYNGDVISELMDEGFYHSRIVTAGNTYYSEDFYVPCQAYGEDVLIDNTFEEGVGDDGHWKYQDFSSFSDFTQYLEGTMPGSGPPTDPAWAFDQARVATFGDNLLWTHNGSTWLSSTPVNGTYWCDRRNGSWYRYQGGWTSVAPGSFPLIITEGESACWNGLANAPIGIEMDEDMPVAIYRVTFTVSNYEAGTIQVMAGQFGFDSGSLTASANGTFSFTAQLGSSFFITIIPADGWEGCITGVFVYPPKEFAECYMKLSWTNCGNVGNTYYGTDLVQAYYLPGITPRPVPQPTENIETQEQEDGSLRQEFARKGIVWTLHIGFVPWYVVDALTDIQLHKDGPITLNIAFETGLGSSNAATLTNVRVIAERDPEVSDCLMKVTMTFEVDNTAVACCDDFTPPCLESCVDAIGLSSDDLERDNYYLIFNNPTFAYYNSSDQFEQAQLCESGIANIVTDLGAIIRTVYWDINETEWLDIATNTLYITNGGDPCTIDLQWEIANGYRGVLQYTEDPDANDYEDVTDDTFDMSGDEWFENEDAFEPSTATGFLRLRIYVDDCTIGYSAAIEYDCGA